MAFEKFNKDMKIISALDDEPNDVGGLTAAALKAKFDEGGEAIKRYINDTLIPAVVADGETEAHRAEAEAARVAAEQTRQSNEETRQANETSRISAENARNVWENYDASKAYAVGNKVAHGGSSYLCIKPCTGIAPPSAEYWLLIAQKGNKGDKGDKGDKGEPGGGGGQPAVEIDISDSITMDETCLWTTLLNLSYDSAAAMKIKQAALAGNAKVTVKIKVSSSAEPERVTLRMVGSQYTDAELGERYNLTGTAVLLGIAPIDVMLGAYGGDPPTYVLGSLRPLQKNKPLTEVDLSDKITLSSENLFSSSVSLGNDKSIGERIKQAALERRAYVTVMFKSKDGALEKVTLQMFGTQSALEDGTPTYSLTGTYVLAGMIPMDIMIGTIIYETNCTVVKRIESVGDKPIYDPVDKPDTTPDGAFLRWSSEQKKWVAEKSPVLIDLYAAGVNADPARGALTFDVSTDIGTQLVAAAKDGGALLKFGFLKNLDRFPVQAYFVGITIEVVEAYQFYGKAFFESLGVNIFFNVSLQNSSATITSFCTIDQPRLPEAADDGALLRWSSAQDKWVAEVLPMAEGGSF